jgi:hypothetical protein
LCSAGGAAALLTKSVTATLPAALLVVLWWRRGRLSWRGDVAPLVPWLLIGATAGLVTAAGERHLIGADGTAFDLSWLQRGLLAGRVIWFYLGNLLWPTELSFIYLRWTIDSGVSGQWVPMLGVIALTICLWQMRTYARAPLITLLLFFGSVFPVLGFINVYPFRYSFVADHFQYLPSLAVIALLAAALTVGARSWRMAARAVFCAGLLGGLGVLTARQSPMYRASDVLYRTTLQRNPECWMAHNNLGLALAACGRHREAVTAFRGAQRFMPDSPSIHDNLAKALRLAGRPREAAAAAEQAARLRAAVRRTKEP